jgi:hypothetical protein
VVDVPFLDWSTSRLLAVIEYFPRAVGNKQPLRQERRGCIL